LTGGFVNDVFAVDLANAPPDWSRLVLRLYPLVWDPELIRREVCAQEVVSAQGAPAPRVLTSQDMVGVLDRPFMLMERLPGRVLLAAAFPGVVLQVPRLLTTQSKRQSAALAMVHALDAEPLVDCFRQAGIDRRAAGPDYWLDISERFIAEWSMDGLRPGLEWLRANRPPDPARPRICHGDLFGGNILETKGNVTGILDWNLVTVAGPEFDVGGQLAAAHMSPVLAPPPVPQIALAIGRRLARGLRGNYPGFDQLDPDALRYYAAGRAFTEMTYKLAAQARVRATGVSERMPTWRPAQCARYFARRTGIRVGG
jgi:aminoglycoside phosphotransferase (APT) family kinase protein